MRGHLEVASDSVSVRGWATDSHGRQGRVMEPLARWV